MPARWRWTLPAILRSARGAAAVVVLAAFVAGLVVTGRPGAARATVMAASVSRDRVPHTTSMQLPDVTGALALLDPHAVRRARASRSHSRMPLHRWVRPFWGGLSSGFGYRWGRLHAGIDLAGPYGSTIVAATDGCISYAGPMSGYGEVMQIADWDGTETVYGHMSAFIRHYGCVHAGEPIARVGSAGDATGPHLHFEVRVGGSPINPIPFLAKRGVYI